MSVIDLKKPASALFLLNEDDNWTEDEILALRQECANDLGIDLGKVSAVSGGYDAKV